VAFIGSGNYATAMLIPAFRRTGARLKTIVSSTGVSALHAGRKFGCEIVTTDTESVFADADVDAVVITTRHDSHAGLVRRALGAGRHVFVEKPLALLLAEIEAIAEEYDQSRRRGEARMVMVGYNRRFAPQVCQMKDLLSRTSAPMALVMTVNAGAIPADHWTQDPVVGGGRIAGEACHFIDLLRFLAGAPITRHGEARMEAATGDTVTIQLGFANGSIGTIHYFANGSKAFPKERLEAFVAGKVLCLDNFRRLSGYGWPGFRRTSLWRQDKGQRACAAAFVRAIAEGEAAPIPFEEVLEVSRITLEIAETLRR
jgi:predicted dehydrogenase